MAVAGEEVKEEEVEGELKVSAAVKEATVFFLSSRNYPPAVGCFRQEKYQYFVNFSNCLEITKGFVVLFFYCQDREGLFVPALTVYAWRSLEVPRPLPGDEGGRPHGDVVIAAEQTEVGRREKGEGATVEGIQVLAATTTLQEERKREKKNKQKLEMRIVSDVFSPNLLG